MKTVKTNEYLLLLFLSKRSKYTEVISILIARMLNRSNKYMEIIAILCRTGRQNACLRGKKISYYHRSFLLTTTLGGAMHNCLLPFFEKAGKKSKFDLFQEARWYITCDVSTSMFD